MPSECPLASRGLPGETAKNRGRKIIMTNDEKWIELQQAEDIDALFDEMADGRILMFPASTNSL